MLHNFLNNFLWAIECIISWQSRTYYRKFSQTGGEIGRSVVRSVFFHHTFDTQRLYDAMVVSNRHFFRLGAATQWIVKRIHSSAWCLWRQSPRLAKGFIRGVFLAIQLACVDNWSSLNGATARIAPVAEQCLH